jgi:hypothetical protein
MDAGTDSLLRDVRKGVEGPPSSIARTLGLLVLLAVVVAGAVGVFGVHSRTVDSTGAGYRLTVTYPQTARSGLDVPWRARIHRSGGLPDDVTLAVSADYFRMFETQGFFPDPDSATSDAKFVYLTFTKPPAGEDLVVDYDAYIQPASQIGKSAVVRLIVGGREQTRVSLRTWLVP